MDVRSIEALFFKAAGMRWHRSFGGPFLIRPR
jgi:hypothetical protein